ncbi:response regulator [Arthrospira platensis NCB002]|uniref:response regulator n=1 Tax=Limnospira platensis TaxID=118562 RepID=UPI00297A1254|nr:response regulator [Arthrospira platensis NCB002]
MSSPNRKLKPTILVVDDEPDNLDLLYRTFHREFKVLKAESGPAALKILEEVGEVAVIISDQRMPYMSGTEFLSLTATQYPDSIRIILTGYTDVEDLVEAINSGKVFKYVTKPWKSDELKAIVQQGLETHNVLKSRTEELRLAQKQESLLYEVTSTIRSCPNSQEMLQRIVETVGKMFEVSYCLLRSFGVGSDLIGLGAGVSPTKQDITATQGKEWFAYLAEGQNHQNSTTDNISVINNNDLELRSLVWETTEVMILSEGLGNDISDHDGPEWQQRRDVYQRADIRSSLIVPLYYRQELLAVLALHHTGSPRNWHEHEVQLAAGVADQAALALSQVRAYEQVRELARREALVNTITNAIRSSLDPQKIFAAITEQLGEALEVDGCALSLWSPGDEYMQCVGLYNAAIKETVVETRPAALSEPDTSTTTNLPLLGVETNQSIESDQSDDLPQSAAPISGNPVLQELIRTRAPVAIADIEQRPDSMVMLPLRSPSKALLVVPLLLDGDIIGSISLRQNHQVRHWQPSEIDMVLLVAAQAALAVQQARLYQKTRQQAERLLEADRLKTEFFQNVSHEFRTPLTLMIGPLETVVNQQQDLSLDQAKIALRNSRRLLRLVNQLLDLQRFDAGRMQPSFRPCDLVEFCQQTVESFKSYCDRKQINLVTNLQSCPQLYLDLERFDKVLYNLLSNAMKFTPTDGTITVSLQPEGNYCRLMVKDTGIGIKQEQLPHLFERFRQAEGSANRSFEGSGLGLALVKELVELHHGRITVESEYGQGTTFTVWLQMGNLHLPPSPLLDVPAEFDARRAAVELADVEVDLPDVQIDDINLPEVLVADGSASLTDHGQLGSNTVLVVDDNPDLRRYVSMMLQNAGFNAVLAKNGADGFNKAQTYHPDVIVTDLMMPQVSGLELIRMIRSSPELRGTPIILLTAKADEDTRIEGVERGADAYVSKPFNDRELIAEVRNLQALKAEERRVAHLNKYLTESVLRRFLPESMVKKAAAGDLTLDLRPEPRLITILFSDIVGFTRMSNALQSQGVAELLNEYLGEMTRAVFENQGTVDKFVGDAIMALYGAPEEMSPSEQVRRAIATARQMLVALEKLNQGWQERGLVGRNEVPPVRFRCGIHQGMAVVGLFGSQERSDFTAIGPSVNIAARLQEATAPNSIMVSAMVAQYVPDEEIIKREFLELKGIDEPVMTCVINPNMLNQ